MTKFEFFKFPQGSEEISQSFYREIYEENEYDRFGISIEENDIVLDCGSNIGIFSKYALDRGASKVISYECDPELFEFYEKNLIDDRVSSNLGFVGKGQNDLAKIIQDNKLEKIDFAKIDIEGHEWDMLMSASDEDILRIEKMTIEFHTFYFNGSVNESNKKEVLWNLVGILDRLSSLGYEYKLLHIHKGWDLVHLFAKKQ